MDSYGKKMLELYACLALNVFTFCVVTTIFLDRTFYGWRDKTVDILAQVDPKVLLALTAMFAIIVTAKTLLGSGEPAETGDPIQS